MQKIESQIRNDIGDVKIVFYEHVPCSYFVNKYKIKSDIQLLLKYDEISRIVDLKNGHLFLLNPSYCLRVCSMISRYQFGNNESKIVTLNGYNDNHQKRINYVSSILQQFYLGQSEISVGTLENSKIGVSNCAPEFKFNLDGFTEFKLHSTLISVRRSQYLTHECDSIYIIYTYARVFRILQHVQKPIATKIDSSILSRDALLLLHILCAYEYCLKSFISENDPFYLYSYLVKLSKIVGKVHKQLRVKDVSELGLKHARGYLFHHCFRIMTELFTVLQFDKITDI